MATDSKTYRILTCYYRPKPGGFCKRLFRAIEALLERGNTVHYLAVVPFPIKHRNCYFHRFPWPENKTGNVFFWGCFHLLAPVFLFYLGIRYRIKRMFAFGTNYALFLQPLRIMMRIPLTLFLRADTLRNHELQSRARFFKILDCLIEGLAIHGTRLYGVSDSLTQDVLNRHRFLKPEKSGTIRNDINDCLKFSNRSAPSGRLRVGCVGILEPRKNQQFLIQAIKEFTKEEAVLCFFGIGPDEKKLRHMARRENVVDRVCFKGWVDSDTIWSNIDILVMPSRHEGAPNAVLEAIGNQVPVLASDIAEHREILPESMLFSLQTPEDLVLKIKNICRGDKINIWQKEHEYPDIISRLNFDWNAIMTDAIILR